MCGVMPGTTITYAVRRFEIILRSAHIHVTVFSQAHFAVFADMADVCASGAVDSLRMVHSCGVLYCVLPPAGN